MAIALCQPFSSPARHGARLHDRRLRADGARRTDVVATRSNGGMGHLDKIDLSASLTREKSERKLERLQLRLLHLRLVCGGLLGSGEFGPPLCVVFEGWDASGKGGAIKRLVG